ncbi:MAG TPA: FAD:protein FMN transferase [Conexibacter sp.]|nr:FAD:protein FMN transferase [Conexibacter sp.]
MSATASWRALGTSAVLVASDAAALADARAAVERELDAIDLAASRFRDDSELSALNADAGRGPVTVSPLLAQAIGVALRAARNSRGAVDPTLGCELGRAGYDRDFEQLPPARADVAGMGAGGAGAGGAPRRRALWSAVRIERETRRVTLPAGVALDLGATAKALAADRAARAAHAAAGCGVLVSLGGDVAVAGPAPEKGWAVRVTEDHAGPAEALGQTVAIRSGGLATSGVTVRRWQAADGPRHHILDPRTGAPAPVVWRTASVAAASCVDANTASTAAIVLGAAAAPWLLRHRLPARLVSARGRVLLVGPWPRRDAPSSPTCAAPGVHATPDGAQLTEGSAA